MLIPSVEVLYNEKNRGFAGGINPGIRQIINEGTEFIWILNNDTQFPKPDVLTRLINTMIENPNVGVLTPLVREHPDTDTIWFWKGTIDWRTANADHVDAPADLPIGFVETEYIPNCCSLFRSSVFEEVGFLPEQYFIYYEDVDHGIRIRNADYRLVTDTRTTVYHEQGGTSGDEIQPFFSYYNGRNTLFLAKRFNEKRKRSFPLSFPIWIGKQIGYRALNGGYSGILPFIRGIFDGLRGCTGKGPYP